MRKSRHLLGGTLVVDAEQGFGDSILGARFLRLARARAARVVLRCQAPLVTLMRTSGVADQVVCLDRGVNGDAYCRLLSLPHLLKLESLPAVTMPYLKPSVDAVRRWAGRLAGPGIAVGLVWSGLASAKQNRYRMFVPARLARVLGGRARLFGLQLPGDGVAACPPGVADLSAELRDFGETAAVLGEIDILVSAETAVAHLGGALGVRTWIPDADDRGLALAHWKAPGIRTRAGLANPGRCSGMMCSPASVRRSTCIAAVTSKLSDRSGRHGRAETGSTSAPLRPWPDAW